MIFNAIFLFGVQFKIDHLFIESLVVA